MFNFSMWTALYRHAPPPTTTAFRRHQQLLQSNNLDKSLSGLEQTVFFLLGQITAVIRPLLDIKRAGGKGVGWGRRNDKQA